MELFILDYWPIIIAIAGVISWFIRLEARAVANTKEIRRLWYVRDEDRESHKEARRISDKKLDQIHVELHEMAKTLTADVKHLLERNSNRGV